MTLHSFVEGIDVGLSFRGDNLSFGSTISIVLQNAPEGHAIGLVVLAPRG